MSVLFSLEISIETIGFFTNTQNLQFWHHLHIMMLANLKLDVNGCKKIMKVGLLSQKYLIKLLVRLKVGILHICAGSKLTCNKLRLFGLFKDHDNVFY